MIAEGLETHTHLCLQQVYSENVQNEVAERAVETDRER